MVNIKKKSEIKKKAERIRGLRTFENQVPARDYAAWTSSEIAIDNLVFKKN